MKIFETTLEYDYKQKLYLILMYETHNEYTAFCVDIKNNTIGSVSISDIVYNIPKKHVILSEYKIQDSPLQGNYILDFYIKKFSEI